MRPQLLLPGSHFGSLKVQVIRSLDKKPSSRGPLGRGGHPGVGWTEGGAEGAEAEAVAGVGDSDGLSPA